MAKINAQCQAANQPYSAYFLAEPPLTIPDFETFSEGQSGKKIEKTSLGTGLATNHSGIWTHQQRPALDVS